jgi:transcriptional regulator with XRE-family HTH domain
MESFGKWLEKTLAYKEWKPAELARRSGLDSAVISNLLNDRRKAGPDTSSAIAEALEIPAEIVFRAAGILPVTNKDEWVDEMAYKLEKLDPSRRKIAEDLLDALLKEGQQPAIRKAKTKPASN